MADVLGMFIMRWGRATGAGTNHGTVGTASADGHDGRGSRRITLHPDGSFDMVENHTLFVSSEEHGLGKRNRTRRYYGGWTLLDEGTKLRLRAKGPGTLTRDGFLAPTVPPSFGEDVDMEEALGEQLVELAVPGDFPGGAWELRQGIERGGEPCMHACIPAVFWMRMQHPRGCTTREGDPCFMPWTVGGNKCEPAAHPD